MKMTTTEMMERMGTEATESEADAMIEIMASSEYSDVPTGEIPENAWLSMIDEAVSACKTV
jgi:uncharacterized protein YbjQ (UPF0145 family)